MRKLIGTLFVTVAMMGSLSLERAFAEATGKMAAMDHKTEMKDLMMEKEACMKEHNDKSMCHDKMMASCESKMTKDECAKMMGKMHDKMKMKK